MSGLTVHAEDDEEGEACHHRRQVVCVFRVYGSGSDLRGSGKDFRENTPSLVTFPIQNLSYTESSLSSAPLRAAGDRVSGMKNAHRMLNVIKGQKLFGAGSRATGTSLCSEAVRQTLSERGRIQSWPCFLRKCTRVSRERLKSAL